MTLIISSKSENLHLIELVDESKNLLDSGHLLVTANTVTESGLEEGAKTYVVVMLLETKRDVPTNLVMRAFCGSSKVAAEKTHRDSNIYTKQIEVPRFAMLVPANDGETGQNAAACEFGRQQAIRLSFRLREKDLQVPQVSRSMGDNWGVLIQFRNVVMTIVSHTSTTR